MTDTNRDWRGGGDRSDGAVGSPIRTPLSEREEPGTLTPVQTGAATDTADYGDSATMLLVDASVGSG